ncbi:acyl-CoA synthetase (AMP-forming)/AMP-acid ligase II [Sphingobium sp. OAS761]|uniref:long-chain-fatty-acid--CoA ligase n=1 Tax=Sphingobium sp. OAS761 TaxID=2817901 RepID=UPI00209EA665|nr:long-chain-fatty-acid--CoA ligase [Sphingobium sp. OAS761]MCP1472358.1 acyl-CoA synthetase (AMP-forming)/AMP-acid ligase II [Sphingobium sp. OAS761]
MSNGSGFTLADVLEANARNYADAPALVFEGTTLSHAEYLARGKRLASAWTRLGLAKQQRVAVMSRNCREMCEVYAASEVGGFITATVSFRFVAPEVAYIINDSLPHIFVFEEEFADLVDNIRGSLTSVEHFVCVGKAPAWAMSYGEVFRMGDERFSAVVDQTDICSIIYTSGTTGRPKGVMISHRAKVGTASCISSLMAAGPSDRILLMMPMFHVGAKDMSLAQSWRAGAIYLHRDFDPELILKTIQDERITITHMAPTMIQMLLDHPRVDDYDLSSLRMIVYSAAAMPTALLRRGLAKLGPVFLQLYGQTEGSGIVLPIEAHLPDGDDRDRRRLQSIGIPFPGVQVRIVDDNDRDCGVDEPGEILLRGPIMMHGYWNNSNATIETLRDGWLRTGDMGKFDDDGYVYLVDRKKDMIVSGGENIYSREVEEALYQHDAVANAAVIGVPDDKWGEAVRAVVELREGASATAADIIAHCRTLIAGYKCPKSVVFVNDLPKLPSGKINKIVIRKEHGRIEEPSSALGG